MISTQRLTTALAGRTCCHYRSEAFSVRACHIDTSTETQSKLMCFA